MGDVRRELHRRDVTGGKSHIQAKPLCQLFSSPPRVLMVPQVPRDWLVKGVLLVCLDSVVKEDSLAFLARR